MRTMPGAGLLAVSLCLAPFAARPVSGANGSIAVPFQELERGDVSGYRYLSPDFAGAELHITNRRSWQEFWALHTRGRSPAPPLPEINFTRQNVIAVLLGNQTSGGGPAIGVRSISRNDRMTSIEVLEDRTPGPLTVITNPYQIVVTPSLGRSIAFLHAEPGARLCQDKQDCPADHVCSRVDPACQSPVTGVCSYRPPGSACPEVYLPVCGCDGVTYGNGCFLELEGAVLAHAGECL